MENTARPMSIQVRPQPQVNRTAAISSSWFLNSSSRSVALWLTSPVALGRDGTRAPRSPRYCDSVIPNK
jgi:hypothetical protein